jgi:chemotaxis protein MotB
MSATAGRKRHKAHEEEEHENEERWLVSYADMMTLLMCLFMVMFSISSVNISKFQDLQRSLQSAFSGHAVAGGKALLQTGSTSQTERSAAEPPLPSMTPKEALNADKASQGQTKEEQQQAAAKEQEEFKALKRRVDAAAAQMHLSKVVQTQIRERGLVVRLLTDGVFFDSGSAQLKARSIPLLHRVGDVIASEGKHPVVVEGYTDSQPIGSSQYPSNWELSGARASSVVRQFVGDGVNQARLSVSGYAAQHPIASNSTASGRSHNRRVEIVMTRLNSTP